MGPIPLLSLPQGETLRRLSLGVSFEMISTCCSTCMLYKSVCVIETYRRRSLFLVVRRCRKLKKNGSDVQRPTKAGIIGRLTSRLLSPAVWFWVPGWRSTSSLKPGLLSSRLGGVEGQSSSSSGIKGIALCWIYRRRIMSWRKNGIRLNMGRWNHPILSRVDIIAKHPQIISFLELMGWSNVGVLDQDAQSLLSRKLSDVMANSSRSVIDRKKIPHLADLYRGTACGNCGNVGKLNRVIQRVCWTRIKSLTGPVFLHCPLYYSLCFQAQAWRSACVEKPTIVIGHVNLRSGKITRKRTMRLWKRGSLEKKLIQNDAFTQVSISRLGST